MKVADYNARLAATMSEADLEEAVRATCAAMGIRRFHHHSSRRTEPGFPDDVLIGAHGVLFRELKTQRGRVSDPQRETLDALTGCGLDAALWRPGDWLSGLVVSEIREIR
jgi:hypothetical protein